LTNLSNRSDTSSGGRVDWNKIRSTSQTEINKVAREDFEELGIVARRLKFYRVLNLPTPDIKKIRQRLHLSQAQFSDRFGFSLRTVQQWEQGRAQPDQPARLLLSLIEFSPAKVSFLVDAVAAQAAKKSQKSSGGKAARLRDGSGTT
jgi:putative transcriptional regulator